MSIRDLGIIEITVFLVLLAAFLFFFGLFVMLRRHQRHSGGRFLRKRRLMEKALQHKVQRAPEEEWGEIYGIPGLRERDDEAAERRAGRMRMGQRRTEQEAPGVGQAGPGVEQMLSGTVRAAQPVSGIEREPGRAELRKERSASGTGRPVSAAGQAGHYEERTELRAERSISGIERAAQAAGYEDRREERTASGAERSRREERTASSAERNRREERTASGAERSRQEERTASGAERSRREEQDISSVRQTGRREKPAVQSAEQPKARQERAFHSEERQTSVSYSKERQTGKSPSEEQPSEEPQPQRTGRVRVPGGRSERSRAAEPIRLWDVNSQSVRTVKRAQQEPVFVEERRISHRRDQLKRLEEASQ